MYLGYLLKLTLVLTLVFAVSIGVVHALTYDAAYFADVRAFLLVDDCATPCWLGIRPGVTTTHEAVAILKQYIWFEHIVISSGRTEDDPAYVTWLWSDAQPAFSFGKSGGRISVVDDVVTSIRLATRISFADMWLTFSRPQKGLLLPQATRRRTVMVNQAVYLDGALFVQSQVRCPLSLSKIWESRVTVDLRTPGEQPDYAGFRDYYDFVAIFT